MARSALARIAWCNAYSGSSRPGESVKMNCASPRVSNPTTGRRVDCGLGDTTARCSPTSAFNSVDLPTLGRPASTTVPQRVIALSRWSLRGPPSMTREQAVHHADPRGEKQPEPHAYHARTHPGPAIEGRETPLGVRHRDGDHGRDQHHPHDRPQSEAE